MGEQVQKLLLAANSANFEKGQFLSLYTSKEAEQNVELLKLLNKMNSVQSEFELTVNKQELRITKV